MLLHKELVSLQNDQSIQDIGIFIARSKIQNQIFKRISLYYTNRLDRGNDAWKERQNQAKLMDVLQDNSSSAQERSPAQVNGESEDAFKQTYATISNISKSLKVPLGL
ncbi:UNVERIFIED_CONTAM: hypothetical protein FKN15_025178 [Acipenser sinensis]